MNLSDLHAQLFCSNQVSWFQFFLQQVVPEKCLHVGLMLSTEKHAQTSG